ncbi:MAG: hypothetical protein KDH09_01215 [Chrysiogenetes bacterium]|nr:hypothetical protein [Chrysiogenetes bacterium]
MRTGHLCSRAFARAFGAILATFLVVLTSSCGDSPLFIGPLATYQEIDVRVANTIPLPGGGWLYIPAGAATAPGNPGIIISDHVLITISIEDEATPQDTYDEEDMLVKNSFTGMLSFGPAGLKFSPAATACFVFDAEDAMQAADAQLFWTNQGTDVFAPIMANTGFPALYTDDDEESFTNPNPNLDNWVFCGDVSHFSRGYIGDRNRDANSSDMGVGDPETFFANAEATYDYDANDINLTGDATFINNDPYAITVVDATSMTMPTVTIPTEGADLVFDFGAEIDDAFVTTIFYDRVTMVRNGWELVVEKPIMPGGPLFFVLSDTDAANNGIIWRFDATGTVGMEGPLYTNGMGFVVENDPYEEPITLVTDNDSVQDPIYTACSADASVAIAANGTATLDVFTGGQPQSAKGGPTDTYIFDWNFDSTVGTQIPPSVFVDSDVIQSVIWCEPDCGATPRDELLLEFTNETFSLGTFTQITADGSISYDFDPDDAASCLAP